MEIRKFIPYGRHEVTNEDVDEVVQTLRSNYITQGPKILEFENELKEFVGSTFSLVVNNGTSALTLSYLATRITEPTSLVVTTPITFVATINPARLFNAKIQLIDIDPETWNLDTEKLFESELKPTHLVNVDFCGNPNLLDQLSKYCNENKVWFIDDASHAFGAEYRGNRIGSTYADLTTFSFHPVKHIAMGEGGAITTDNPNIYEKLELLRTHGITKSPEKLISKDFPEYYYEQQEISLNFRISDINVALGLSQLKRIQENINTRNKLAKVYKDLIDDWRKANYQKTTPNSKNAYHIFPIKFQNLGIKRRDEIFKRLRNHGIGVQIHYIPLFLHPIHRSIAKPSDFPNALDYFENCLTLPLYPELREDEIKLIFDRLKSAYKQVV